MGSLVHNMTPSMRWSAVILISLLNYALSLRDLTEFPNASGEEVVNAVIARLDSEFADSDGTFWTEGDDSVFFKDLALVESEYGNSFTADNDGGIWQVTSSAFEDTKDILLIRANPDYARKIDEISDAFDIAWQVVDQEELAKPLYSLLAARLALHLEAIDDTGTEQCDSVPSIDDKQSYPQFWLDCYRNGMGNISDFEEIIIEDVEGKRKY